MSTTMAPEVALEQRKSVIRAAARRNWPRAAHTFTVDAGGAVMEDATSRLAWAVEVKPLSVVFQPVRWDQREEAIATGIEVAIPPEAAPSSENPIHADARRARDLLGAYQRADVLRRRLRGVADDDDTEVARLVGQVPSGAHDAAGLSLGWRVSLRRLAVESAEASGMLVALQATHHQVGAFLAEVAQRVRAATIVATATPHGLDAIRPLTMLGADPIAVRPSAAEEAADALDDLLGRLQLASAEVATALPILDRLTRRVVTATVAAIGQVERRETTAALARLAAEAEALQRPSAAAELAAEAARRLG